MRKSNNTQNSPGKFPGQIFPVNSATRARFSEAGSETRNLTVGQVGFMWLCCANTETGSVTYTTDRF